MLRTRLYLGLLPLLLLIIATGVYAIHVCRDLAGSLSRDLIDNYRAVIVSQQMRSSVSLMSSALAPAVLGALERRAFEEHRAAFAGGFPPEVAEPLAQVLRTGDHFVPADYRRTVTLRVGRRTATICPAFSPSGTSSRNSAARGSGWPLPATSWWRTAARSPARAGKARAASSTSCCRGEANSFWRDPAPAVRRARGILT